VLSTSLVLSTLLMLSTLSCRGQATVMLSEVSDSLSVVSSIVPKASISPPEDIEDRRSYGVGCIASPGPVLIRLFQHLY
jgi:hypothetical protein